MELIPRRLKKQEETSRELAPFSLFRNEIDRLFDRFLTNPWGAWEETAFSGFAPLLDVKETDKDITVKAELPGIDPKEIDISVTGRRLTIRGEKKEEREEEKGNFYRSERRFGSFQRIIELPENVNVDAISADYTHGLLTVRVPKVESAQARKIQVSAK